MTVPRKSFMVGPERTGSNNMAESTTNRTSKLGRRRFLKGAVVSGVAGVVASGSIIAEQKDADSTATCKPSWETLPAPIPTSEIKNTVTTEVVVIGAGVAGVVTALSAAEGGAKVVVLEKLRQFSARGFDIAAIDSRVQIKMGLFGENDATGWRWLDSI
jgi:fumarate reductase flavoprotein subunit